MLVLVLAEGTAGALTQGGTPPSLQATVAQANALSNEIDSLSQQYDALNIQLQQARSEAAAAQKTAAQDEKALRSGQAAVAQIAAQGYMTGGVNPTIQLLQTSDPQTFLNRSSILLELSHEQSGKISLLSEAEAAANRAKATADQEEAKAAKLSSAMQAKVSQIQQKENLLNSQAYSQALAVFQQTGSYPDINITGDTVGEQALRYALTRIGDPYVWGGAGPDEFDCSGLVMWAYEQVGIQLDHYTGDQWDEGIHVSRSQLQPGDLVFFYSDLSHVGLYIGGNLMVDAPSAGQDVQVQEIFSPFEGGVHIP